MSSQKEKDIKRKMRVILLVIIGGTAFVVSILINIFGITSVINKDTNSSGMAGFSVRITGDEKNDNLKETKVDENGKIAEDDILINSLPIITLKNNNWDRLNSKFSGFQLDEEGNAIFEEGYKLYCNGKYVNYVVFNSDYKDEVLGKITVGTDFKTIEKKLGVPTFKTKNYLGYKTKEVYVFFYENEIAVYPNRKISNDSLEELFSDYIEKKYEKERTYFLVDIRNNFEDIKIEFNENNNEVTLISTTRQFVAKLDNIGNIEVEFYNGYNVSTEKTKEYIKEKIYITNEEDLVEVVENERVSGK